jgi:hypothetical protein
MENWENGEDGGLELCEWRNLEQIGIQRKSPFLGETSSLLEEDQHLISE